MIKLVEWILGHHAAALDDERTAAEQDVQASRVLRARAEKLATDGFTEGYVQAFYANDRRRRRR